MSYFPRINLISNGVRGLQRSAAVPCVTSRHYQSTTTNVNGGEQRLSHRSDFQLQKAWKCSFSTAIGPKLEKVSAKVIQKHDWDRAVSEAEKIVGYPTSFLSLRWLLSDEVANVAIHLRKLIGSRHPLLKTAKTLLYQGRSTTHAWGLIVLLISKAAGHSPAIPEMERDKSAGVLHSQRALAEIIEMIRISHLIHQGMVNLQPMIQAGQDTTQYGDMIYGNKITILTGDYLLGNSCKELANLRNQDLVELISSVVRDQSESEFIGLRDEQNNPLPSKPGRGRREMSLDELNVEIQKYLDQDIVKPAKKDAFMLSTDGEWMLRNLLSTGSLLGRGCQGALKLAQVPEDLQHIAFRFGYHLSLTWQASHDLEVFEMSTLPADATFSLVSAPVLFHLEHDPSLYEEIEKGVDHVENIAFQKVLREVSNGPGIEKTQSLQRLHSLAAMKLLNRFPDSEARSALHNILLAMQDI